MATKNKMDSSLGITRMSQTRMCVPARGRLGRSGHLGVADKVGGVLFSQVHFHPSFLSIPFDMRIIRCGLISEPTASDGALCLWILGAFNFRLFQAFIIKTQDSIFCFRPFSQTNSSLVTGYDGRVKRINAKVIFEFRNISL